MSHGKPISSSCVTIVLASLLALAGSAPRAQETVRELEKIGTVAHPPIAEASGLVASRRHPGVLWTVSDSGSVPHLFAIDRTGKLLAEYRVNEAVNFDWESLALDDQGNLYVGDVGNNLLVAGRWVFQVREPDPHNVSVPVAGPATVGTVSLERTFHYRFDPVPFDCEGTFVFRGSLYLLSKVGQKTALYRLGLEDATKPQTVVEVCDVPAIHTVTGADIAADGRRVAVCSYREVVVFDLEKTGVQALAGEPVQRLGFRAPNVEGCAWDGEDLLLISEDRSLYRLRPGKRP